ncbi:hypothetical protein G9A89_002265 [Geosiphon pyriformis]|nr:hypothetical protein G9A89_002265 [Geosiphon pyriformis]
MSNSWKKVDIYYNTETSNKGKQKLKQYSKTTPNTSILPKTTAKHLQTSEQRTNVKLPLSITLFPISLVQSQTPSSPLKHFSRPEDYQLLRNPTQQQEPILTSANIIDYLQENKSNHSKSLKSEEIKLKQEETTENKEEMATAYIVKIPEFTGKNNDTSPQEWLNKVQKAGDVNGWIAARMLKAIPYFLQGTFITGLKDKLIKKVCPHALVDLATAIRHAKNYEMAIKEANHTKLINLAIGETSSAAEEKIDQLTKKVESYFTNQQQQQQQPQRYQPPQQCNQNKFGLPFNNQPQNYTGNEIVGNYKETNKIEIINVILHHNNLITNLHHQLIIYQNPKIKTITINQLHNQCSNNITNLYQFSNIRHNPLNNIKINPNNQLVPRNSGQQRPNYFHTQPNIFSFEFEANELPFLLNNTAANEQKAITAMYTEATVEGKPIQLILNTQTVIVIADGMKKTLVGEINNFPFTIDGITIPVKVLVMNAPQYQALKAPVFEFKEEKKIPLTETYMALGSTSNWAEETEQEIFEESRE